jgi:hypothetical protein
MPESIDSVRYLGDAATHQKMYDFWHDVMRVKNPLNEDFSFVYDGLPVVIPAGGTRDMERYFLRVFIPEMIGHIYNQFAAPKMEEMKEKFERTHPDIMSDPYLINEQIYLKMKRSDDPEFQKKVCEDCIVGVVKKYGSDRQLPRQQQVGKLDPNTPLYMKYIEDFKTVIVDKPEATIDKKYENKSWRDNPEAVRVTELHEKEVAEAKVEPVQTL